MMSLSAEGKYTSVALFWDELRWMTMVSSQEVNQFTPFGEPKFVLVHFSMSITSGLSLLSLVGPKHYGFVKTSGGVL